MPQINCPTSSWQRNIINGASEPKAMALLAIMTWSAVKQRRVYGIVELAAVVLSALNMAAGILTAVGAVSTGLPSGLGFNLHIVGTTRGWAAIHNDGARFVRRDFFWSGIETKKGVYHFGLYNKEVKGMEARGLRPIFILDYGNPLYPPPETTVAGRDAYARWAAASAAHFKGKHVIWEIWNEPNVGFWRHAKGGLNSPHFADEYVALLTKTVTAMRAANPHCYILGGAVSCLWSGSFRWVREAFKRGLLQTDINALSVHPYGFTRPETEINAHQPGAVSGQGYSTLREMMAQYHRANFPVVATEVGYPTGHGVTLQDQADLSVRQYLVDEMCNVPLTVLYNWDSRQAGGFAIRGRLVYKALKVMTAQLNGYHYVRRLHVGTKLDYVIEFQKANGHRRIIAWTVPKDRDASQSRAVAHEAEIPVGTTADLAKVENIYGKQVAALAVGGRVTVRLTAAPIYVDLAGH